MVETWRLGHRPGLDGLRGLAVLLVLADHGGLLPQPAGAMGVALFFVLSGFLITRLMVESRERGQWSYRRFVGNRAARLAPALVTMVAAVSAWWLASGRPVGTIVGPAAVALLYVGDFTYGPQMGTVFHHTWSLAVEEQFYLVWPLALGLLGRRWRWVVGGTLLASLALRLTTRPDLAFSTSLTNAYALLAGCWLALEVTRLPRAPRWVEPAALGLLAVAVWGFHDATDVVAVLRGPVVAVVLAVPLVWGLLAGGLLTLAPLRLAGRVSYAAYLWHWPLLWITDTDRGGLHAVPVLAVSLVVATASTVWLEEPIRRWWRSRVQAEQLRRDEAVSVRQGHRQDRREVDRLR